MNKSVPDFGRKGYKRFNALRKGIRVRDAELGWPNSPVPRSGPFNGNNYFRDLRGKSWLSAGRALQLEQGIFALMETGREGLAQEHLRRKIGIIEARLRLDIGTIAAVYSISAAGGIPISSCNAGAFGGFHEAPFPLIGFYWPRALMPTLRQCAVQAGVSLWTHHRGEVVVGADYIPRLLVFARELQDRQAKIEKLRARIRPVR